VLRVYDDFVTKCDSVYGTTVGSARGNDVRLAYGKAAVT